MQTFKGSYQITGWDESSFVENEDGSKQSLAKVSCQYSGDIEGSAKTQFLMAYSRDGNAKFTGFETLNCTINGKQGDLVLQHNGQFISGVASSTFTIITESSSEIFKELEGSGQFESTENGQANYTLNVD